MRIPKHLVTSTISATMAVAAVNFPMANPGPPIDPDREIETQMVQNEGDFRSLESTSSTTTRFKARRGEVCTAHSGGVIRFDSTSGIPKLYTNSSHISVGINSVSKDSAGRLLIDHEGGPIVTMFADADETLSARNITFGMSGGGGTTRITATDHKLGRVLNLNKSADWRRVQGSFANIWVGWEQVVPCTS